MPSHNNSFSDNTRHDPILISVLMPVYNGEAFLAEAIASVLNQTHRHLELLILDDCSTDRSPEIAEAFQKQDDRVRVLRNQANRKLAYTLNRGLKEAQSPYIARMDADDLCHPERFEKQLAFLKAHPQVGVLGTALEPFSEENPNRGILKHPETNEAIKAKLLFQCAFAHPSVMFHRQAIQTDLFYDEAAPLYEDYGLWIRLLPYTQFANLREPLLRYRCHSNQLSAQTEPMRLADQQTFRTLFEQLALSVSDADFETHLRCSRNRETVDDLALPWLKTLRSKVQETHYLSAEAFDTMVYQLLVEPRLFKKNFLKTPSQGRALLQWLEEPFEQNTSFWKRKAFELKRWYYRAC
jgi:Glycosyl transferase family 2